MVLPLFETKNAGSFTRVLAEDFPVFDSFPYHSIFYRQRSQQTPSQISRGRGLFRVILAPAAFDTLVSSPLVQQYIRSGTFSR